MKYILIICLLFSLKSFSQADSSRTKVSITLTAKVCEYMVLYFDHSNKYEDIDSTTKKKFRIASPPTNNTTVQIDSVEGRVLIEIYNRLSLDPIALSDTVKVARNFEDGMRQTGNTWINHKIDVIKTDKVNQWLNIRQLGQDYLRKNQN